jgi:hypothetical protein
VRELEDWRGRFDVEVGDGRQRRGDWHGRVGVVPRLIPAAAFDAAAAPRSSSARRS